VLFDPQQPTLLVAIAGMYGIEHALSLDEPWLGVRIDVGLA
jgi:hypothetical protein